METLTKICTCDDFCDTPCPAHGRGNTLQDMVLVAQELADNCRRAIALLRTYHAPEGEIDHIEAALSRWDAVQK